MADLIGLGTSGGIGSLVGVIVAALGFRSRMTALELRQRETVTKDHFTEFKEGYRRDISRVENGIKEVGSDVKKLLERRAATRTEHGE